MATSRSKPQTPAADDAVEAVEVEPTSVDVPAAAAVDETAPAADVDSTPVVTYRSAAVAYAAQVSGACDEVTRAVEALADARAVLNDLAPGYDEARMHFNVGRIDGALRELVAAVAPVRGMAADLASS